MHGGGGYSIDSQATYGGGGHSIDSFMELQDPAPPADDGAGRRQAAAEENNNRDDFDSDAAADAAPRCKERANVKPAEKNTCPAKRRHEVEMVELSEV
jgi:hypothetical protein